MCQGISLHLIPRLHLSEIRYGTFSGRCSPSTMTMQPREQWQLCQAWALEQMGQAPLKDTSFPLSRQGHSTEENVPQAVSWWKTPSVMEEDGVTMVTMCKPVRSSEASDLPASLILTWCLLTMSFNFPSSLGSISGHRKMLGRDRQLFCEKKKSWDEERLFYVLTVEREMERVCAGILPAPRTSQWSWTFPRCGPCGMGSGNRNAAL